MPFQAQRTFVEEKFPGRVYIHSGGFSSVFENSIDKAFDYFRQEALPVLRVAILTGEVSPANPVYFLATIWGDEKTYVRKLDAFVFGDIKNWPGNPEFAAGVIQENRLLISPLGRVVGCGDSLIMLGAEEKLRRKTDCLAHYLNSSVGVNDIPWV